MTQIFNTKKMNNIFAKSVVFNRIIFTFTLISLMLFTDNIYGQADTQAPAPPANLKILGSVPDQPPVLYSIGNKSIDEGSTLNFSLIASDPDNDILNYSATGMPNNATFDTTTGEFYFLPGSGDVGTYNVTFSVSDANSSDSETITINVNPAAGNIYYVDANNGNDNNNGSIASPFKTLMKALSVVSTRVNQGIRSDKIYLRGGTYRNDGSSNSNDFILYDVNLKGTSTNPSLISAMPCAPNTPGCVQRKSGQWYEKVVFDDGMTITSTWTKFNNNIWKTNPGYLNFKWGNLARQIGTLIPDYLALGARMVLQDGESLLWEDPWVNYPTVDPPAVLTGPGMRTYDQNTGTLYVWPYNNKNPNTAKMESWKGTTPDIKRRHMFEGSMEYAEIKGIEFRLFTSLLKTNYLVESYQYLTWEDNVFSYGWKHFFQDQGSLNDKASFIPRVGWQIRYNVFYRPSREIFQIWGNNHVFEYNEIIERNGPWAGGAAKWSAINLRHMDNTLVRYNYINHLGNKWTGSSVIMFEQYTNQKDGSGNCKWNGGTIEHNFIGKMNGGTIIYLGRSGCRMSNITIRDNVFAVNPGIGVKYNAGNGIQITSPQNNLQIYNNVFYDVKIPIRVKDDKGNTYLGSLPSTVTIRDNIFMNNPSSIDSRLLIPGVTINRNLFYQSGSTVGSSPKTGNPLFTDPSKFNFTLKSGSPAIVSGDDLGAYNFGSVPSGTEWWLY